MKHPQIINIISKIVPLIILAFIFTALFTWPFIINLNSFYYDRGDYQLSGANLSYNANAILSGKIFNSEDYFNGYQYYPEPYSLLYSDLRFFPSLLFLPVNALTNNFIFSVNMTTFLSFVLSFISAFYVIRYFLDEILPKEQAPKQRLLIFLSCLIGSLVFTFNQLTFARLPEHFELLNKCFLPLIFLFAYKFIKSPNWINSGLFFISFLLNALSAVYYFIFSLVLLPLFALPVFIYFFKKIGLFYFFRLLKYSLVGLFIIPFLIYLYNPYNEFSDKENAYRTLNQSSYFSARLIDFFSTSKTNLLYGNVSKYLDEFRSPKDKGVFNYIEHNLAPGILPVLLFTLVIILLFRKKIIVQKPLLIGLLLTLGISFILCLGPFYQGWNDYQGTFKLPFYYFYESFSFFKSLRAPTRAFFFFYVPFSVFVSIGVYFVLKRCRRSTLIVIAASIFVVFLFLETYDTNFLNSFNNEKSKIIPQIENLAQGQLFFRSLSGKKTVHYPIYYPEVGLDSTYLNWSAITHEIVMNGNSGYFPSDQIDLLLSIKDYFNVNTIKSLKAIKLDYIIIHKDLMSERGLEIKAFSDLYNKSIVYQDDKIVVFEVNKFPVSLNLCNEENQINSGINYGYDQRSLQLVAFIVLDNKSDCYLANIYKNKYKEIKSSVRDLYGNQNEKSVSVKYPVLIKPNERIILSENNMDIKIN